MWRGQGLIKLREKGGNTRTLRTNRDTEYYRATVVTEAEGKSGTKGYVFLPGVSVLISLGFLRS